jgi:CubicO group peptidase (beta-lactamase class C family)
MNRREVLGLAAASALVACRSQATDRLASPSPSSSPSATTEPPTTAAPPTTTQATTTQATTTEAAMPSSTALARPALDYTTFDQFVAATGGQALMITQAGIVVHEWYHNGDAAFSRDIASAQKSVLSLLIGIAIDQGLCALDTAIDTVIGPGWAEGDSSAITVFHLMTMTSGLNNNLQVIDQPGRAWRYNNAFAVLFQVLEELTARQLNDVANEWLFEPIGATGAEFRERLNPSGAAAAVGLVCTAAQLSAIGEMVLGHRTLQMSIDWLEQSLKPSQTLNLAYGLLWWLNGQASYLVPEGLQFSGPLIPNAPSDLVAALGKDDQKLYIAPSADLVVVRLGNKAADNSKLALSSFDNDMWRQLSELGLSKPG